MNIGDAMEFPRIGTVNGAPSALTLNREHFRLIQLAGFQFVRIPISPHPYTMIEAPYTVDAEYLKRLDWVIKNALQSKLAVILDFHRYDELLENPPAHSERFIAIWQQLAKRYKSYSSKLYFELLNEPANQMSAEHWNTILNSTLSEIRKTNRKRYVIVGPVAWNGIPMLNALQLPADDRRILVTFHFYDPMTFTHQGAEWVDNSSGWLGNRWLGSELQRNRISDLFDEAAWWSRTYNRPLLLGEFGAYNKADMEDRVRWTTFVRETSEARNIPWAYWDFFDGFGIFDRANGMLIKPLWSSLIPVPRVSTGAGFNQSLQIVRSPLYGFDEQSKEGWHASATPSTDEGKLQVGIDSKRKHRGAGALKVSYNQQNDVLIYGEKKKFALNGFHPQRLQAGNTLDMWVWLPKTTNITALQAFTMDNKWSWRDNWIDTTQTNFKKGAWNKISLTISDEAEFKKYGLLIHTKDGLAGDMWIDSIHVTRPLSNQ
jgi:endoglucanase